MGTDCTFTIHISLSGPSMQHNRRALTLLQLHRLAPALTASRVFSGVPHSNHSTAPAATLHGTKQEAPARPLLRSELDRPSARRTDMSSSELRQVTFTAAIFHLCRDPASASQETIILDPLVIPPSAGHHLLLDCSLQPHAMHNAINAYDAQCCLILAFLSPELCC